MRFSWSTHLLCLSLETLTSIIRTGSSILVELIDLVKSVIIFLSQMTLLRWLTFLLGSLTMTLTALLLWIYFSLLMLVFVLQWLFLHWEILIMLFRVSSSCKIKIQPKFHVFDLFFQPKKCDFAYFFQLPASILY